jgi:hypothetical protein
METVFTKCMTNSECQKHGCTNTDAHWIAIDEHGNDVLLCIPHAIHDAWDRGYRAGRSDTLVAK